MARPRELPALAAAREAAAGGTAGDAIRLRCIVLDDPRAIALGNEPVRIGRIAAEPLYDPRGERLRG